MGFLDTLRGWAAAASRLDLDSRGSVEAGDTSGDPHPEFPGEAPAADPGRMAAPVETSAFDRTQWQKKLKKILDRLPDSQVQWSDLNQEAHALNFGDDWIERTYREEFALLIQKIVSDRRVTADEHRMVDLARSLMGISDAEAEETLQKIAAEAAQFFGEPVEGA